MPYANRRCGCNLCQFNKDPINGRVVRIHEAKYGLYTRESPLSSPLKSATDHHDHDSSNDRYFQTARPTTDSESEQETNCQDESHGNQDEYAVCNDRESNLTDDTTFEYDYSNELNGCDLENPTEETAESDCISTSSEEESISDDEVKSSSNPWSVDYNKEIYSTGIAVQKLPNSEFTLLQWLAMNFMLFSSHPSFSKQTFTENLRMQKTLQNDSTNSLPSSYYEARQLIQPYLVKQLKYDVCINDCVIYRDSKKSKLANLQQCPNCGEERYVLKKTKKSIPRRTYGYIPIGPRLARIYGETNLAKLVQSHPGDTYNGSEMYDIHHSSAWKSLYSHSEGSYFNGDKMGISFALEMDGVNPYHNIGVLYSMTPMMLTILNLPRHVRNSFSNINLIGIIKGRRNHGSVANTSSIQKSDEAYVEHLVDELLYLTECKAYHKGPVDVKIKLLLFVLDYPGLSKLFNQHRSGSLAGCHWCHIQGVKCKHLDKVLYLSNSDQMTEPKSRNMLSEQRYREAYANAKNKTQAGIIATATG